MEWTKIVLAIAAIVSCVSSAISANFAYRAIKENKKNVFLKDKNGVALAVRELTLNFNQQWDEFKISGFSGIQTKIFNSKYFMDEKIYGDLIAVLNRLHRYEYREYRPEEKSKEAEEISSKLKDLQCKIRLDQ
ncbi:hypothetical protein L1077_03205 [Pseudoalteromonas luteoviolacea]|uniref:hypothetical protein n=1 Tax=Pseudoalteromonas luteoviolacea TaxID=43657 RepID=UPI001F2D805C|nr:hypothetical protein [Pseudoalteromonas luteoviolacea]MCF6438437.1 hypothetical protein [Pseudoalteromonas luteoviolacea]